MSIVKNEFKIKPSSFLDVEDRKIPVFSENNSENIDEEVVSEFGEEWIKFSEFAKKDLDVVGYSYFSLFLDNVKEHKNMNALDIGCGTGRWAYYLADKVNSIDAVDPSKAVISASKMLKEKINTRVINADLENIPFDEETFDLVYSLGVLHHIPDTQKAINKAVSFVKPGKYFLVYLYYALDNRGFLFKSIFHLSNVIRMFICRLPGPIKRFVCDLIAILVYLPLVSLAKLFRKISKASTFWKSIPLSVYAEHDNSFQILRNDALDRFGTKLEQRFSQVEIKSMLESAGLSNIQFSENPPYWVAMGTKV